jgi:hypothetical protein
MQPRIDRLTVFPELNVERWTLRCQRQSRRTCKSCLSHGGHGLAGKHETPGFDLDLFPFRQEPRGGFLLRIDDNHLSIAAERAGIGDPAIGRGVYGRTLIGGDNLARKGMASTVIRTKVAHRLSPPVWESVPDSFEN